VPSPVSSTLIAILGIPVMAIGLVGWIMPVIPGAPLFFVGLAMTIGWHPKGRALVTRMKNRMKSLALKCGLWSKSSTDLNEDLFKPTTPSESKDDHVRTDQG
jgi:hypothetical protein